MYDVYSVAVTEYDDMGDSLLSALVSRARALEEQLRYAAGCIPAIPAPTIHW